MQAEKGKFAENENMNEQQETESQTERDDLETDNFFNLNDLICFPEREGSN